jgi:hypothetical protein
MMGGRGMRRNKMQKIYNEKTEAEACKKDGSGKSRL